MKSWWRAAAPIALAVSICLLPVPAGLPPKAWYYFALFLAVILGLILEPIGGATIGLIGVTLAAILRLVEPAPADSIRWALSGFSDTTVWLIFVAYNFVLGYEKTGLGRRIALTLVKWLGRRTLGLGYAVALADLVLAPFTPSNTARSGGTIFPIVRSIPPLYGSLPGETSRKIGSYLMWTAFATTSVTSSMFLTAMAPNLLAVSLVQQATRITLTWREWFVGFLPVGFLLICSLPALVYKIYPPTLKVSHDVPVWAGRELANMGPISKNERVMGLLVLIALLLWIFAGEWINATTVALLAVCLMILTNLITWEDVLGYRQSWDMLIWFATLLTLAAGLNKVGFLNWFATVSASALGGLSHTPMMVMFVLIFFLVHYVFASLTAHAAALLPVFLAAASGIPGMPMKLLALLLCYSLGLMGVISPYSTGPAVIYYGSGYIPHRDFWVLGFLLGFIYLFVFLIVGLPYLLVLNMR